MGLVSQKYIDLIYKATSKYANWDPSRPIQVGDFGTINKETGLFEWEGNIYRPQFQQQLKPSEIASLIDLAHFDLRPQLLKEENKLVVKSAGLGLKEATGGPRAELGPSVATVALNFDFQFKNTAEEALLVMLKPRCTILPNDERISSLFSHPPEILKKKCVVTDVISCEAYTMNFSNKVKKASTVSLAVTAPIVTPVSAGGEVGFNWSTGADFQYSREGTGPAGNYIPLFSLKTPRTKKWYRFFRGHMPKEDDLDCWENVVPPWDEPEEDNNTRPNQPMFALLIGINEYSDPKNNLLGAVPDVEAMQTYLQVHLGVDDEHITVYRNSEATRDAILDGIRRLENDTRIEEGDPILIYYAGHGADAPAPEDWNAPGGKVQSLVPYDHNENNMRLIPDRTLGALLTDLAKKKGNNITLILDTCYSGARDKQYATRLVRSIDVAELPSDLDRDIWDRPQPDSNITTWAGFATKGSASHVVLTACGAGEQAMEEQQRGVFTRAILSVLESVGARNLTYRDLLLRIPSLPMQNPQCEGINQGGVLFNAKAAPPLVIHKIRNAQDGFTLDAGAAHGVTMGAQFAVYQDEEAARTGKPLGTVVARHPETFSATMDVPAGESSFALNGEGAAVQVYAGKEEDLRIHLKMDDELAAEVRDVIVGETKIALVDESSAELEIGFENKRFVFSALNPVVTQLGLTRMPVHLDQNTPQDLFPMLRAASHYFWHLRRKNPKGTIQKQIDVEFRQLFEGGTMDNPTYTPGGPNLISNNMIDLTIKDGLELAYGIKIQNNSDLPLYPVLFYFDNSDLSIESYYQAPVAKPGAPAPLPAGGSLTIGYGDTQTDPQSYFLRDSQKVDTTPFVINARGDKKSRVDNRPHWDTILIPIVQRRFVPKPKPMSRFF